MTDHEPLLFLIVDDSPGRYEEFTRLLDERKHRWLITHDAETWRQFATAADAILLDHDMPGEDGRQRVAWLTREVRPVPVIVTSTAGLVWAREGMVSDLGAHCFPAYFCPADHMNCEIEWLAWAEGACAAMGRP